MASDTSKDQLFAGRAEFDVAALCEAFSISDQQQCGMLTQCLSVFEQEYGVRMGQLRPGDSLALFTEAMEGTRNPFTWLVRRAALEDRASELSYQLKQQRARLGLTPIPPAVPRTIGDYVVAWMGPH